MEMYCVRERDSEREHLVGVLVLTLASELSWTVKYLKIHLVDNLYI